VTALARRLTIALALAAFAAAILPLPAAAQNPPATPKAQPAKPKTQPPAAAPSTPAPASATNGRPPDLAFGAFQRGYYITAFALATKNVDDKADPKAMTLLGELYANGLGVPQNDQKAAEWYKLAADRGDREAMFALAMFRLAGRAGPRDRDASAYDLALLYIEGQLFPQDFNRAAELMRVAAQAGNPEAQYALGTLYKGGRGVAKDMHQAVYLFGLAALADYTDAQVEYAIALYNGDGIERNQQVAAALFHNAALKNNPVAQNRLAHILASGLGAPADPVAATKWHLISKARGENDLALDDFVAKLDPEKRAAGEAAAKKWIDALKGPPL
jgi:TPR repeat protein